MDVIEKNIKKKKKKDQDTAAVYAAALDVLDAYLDLVELPPIDSVGRNRQDDERRMPRFL